MGTISDKSTYLNTTKTKIREGLNDLGAELTENDTFRSYAEALENVWNEYPKVSATDVEEASLDGTKKGRMNIDLKGQTEQEQLEGYQLLDLPDYNTTQNGVTVKIENGVMSFSGTLNSPTTIDIPITDIVLNSNDKYSVKMNNKNTVPNGFGRYLLDENKSLIRWSYGQAGLRDEIDFSPTADTIAKYFRIAMHIADTTYNLSSAIMFETGSTSHDFEPYCRTEYQPQILLMKYQFIMLRVVMNLRYKIRI